MGFGLAVLPWQFFIMVFGILVLCLAFGDQLLGTYCIAHRIGGLFVVRGCSKQVRGYFGGFVYCRASYFVWRHYLVYCLDSVELLPLEEVVMIIKIRPGL